MQQQRNQNVHEREKKWNQNKNNRSKQLRAKNQKQNQNEEREEEQEKEGAEQQLERCFFILIYYYYFYSDYFCSLMRYIKNIYTRTPLKEDNDDDDFDIDIDVDRICCNVNKKNISMTKRKRWRNSRIYILEIIKATIVVANTKFQMIKLCQGICIIRLITLKRFLELPSTLISITLRHKRHQQQLQQQQQQQSSNQQREEEEQESQQWQQQLQRTFMSASLVSSPLHLTHFRPETLLSTLTKTTTTTTATTTMMTKTASTSKAQLQRKQAVLAPARTVATTKSSLSSVETMVASSSPSPLPPPAWQPQSALRLYYCCYCCCSRALSRCLPTPASAASTSTTTSTATKTKARRKFSSWLHIISCRVNPSVSLTLPAFVHTMMLLLLVLSTIWPGAECFHGSVKLSANTVKTKYGLLRGIVVRSSPLVEAYLGIPYASPPVGSLRFMPPITPSTWKTIRNADRFSAVCPQTVPIPPNGPEALLEVPRARLAQLRRLLPLLNNQSEDCLYLNIYVPYEAKRYKRYATNRTEQQENAKISTVVFIHGESFDWSSGNPYDGSELAAHGNVIVVTINFRLGIFGFLKTGGKESAQGNFGLMDLVAGLHWLKENLPAFGGDPQSITLLGYGTGAVLANILVVSPVASDLIQRTVLISGSALSPWAIQKNPLFVKRRVAEQTGCHGDLLYDDLAPCLRTKSVAELLAVKVDHPRFLVGFAPFVDGTVISPSTDSIGTITLPLGSAIVSTTGIEYANFPKRELIFCLTSVESYLDLSAQDLEFGFNETRRDRILRTFVRNNYHYHLNEIFAVLKNEYTDWEKAIRNPLSARDATLSFLSDGHTASSLIKLGYMHSLRGGRAYFLHFKHRTVEEEYPQRAGSVRGEDIPFWLGLPISPLFPHNYTTQERQISRLMLRYLANFAKTGNPNQSATVAATLSSLASPSLSSSLSSPTASGTTSKVQQLDDRHQPAKRAVNVTGLTALNLAVLYNQRRSNAMREKRTYYKRRLRSNDGNAPELAYGAEEPDIGSYDSDEMPFWDAYDVVNQLYLELGNKANIQSHYRGHKLSMWLNLIPQLHRHFNINDQSMRHHQFQDDMNNRELYEGVVRPQLQTKPADDEETVLIQPPRATPPAPPQRENKTRATVAPGATTTECGIDGALYVSELTTTEAPKDNRSVVETQKDMATASTGIIGNLEVLRRLGGKQFQSYTTALIATVAVGCFLLILNVLIFAGIYHQREKRARDAKTKEELQDSDTSKNSSMIKLNTLAGNASGSYSAALGGKATVVFGEYNCYDEKSKKVKDEALIVELPSQGQTSLMLDPATSWAAACSTSTLDLLKTKEHNIADLSYTLAGEQTDVHLHPISAMEMVTYNPMTMSAVMDATVASTSAPPSKRGSFIDTSSSQLGAQFDYAVQSSDQLSFKDIENAVKAVSDADITHDDDIPEPPPPPRSYQQHQQQQQQANTVGGGGILRQTGASGAASSASGTALGGNKKRVHIQEISV